MLVNPYPKIAAPTASDICKGFTPRPAAQALLKPQLTPAEYLTVLEKNKQSEDAVKLLAHGMPERESVWWACQSSQKVAGQLQPADKAAVHAAENWVKNPSAATKAQAAAAAAKTDYRGPGAWAAQAAAWSQTGITGPQTPTVQAPSVSMPVLTPHAVAGSVMLAAAMPKLPAAQAPTVHLPKAPRLEVPKVSTPRLTVPQMAQPETTPAELAEAAEMRQPFIGLGKDVASGKNAWV